MQKLINTNKYNIADLIQNMPNFRKMMTNLLRSNVNLYPFFENDVSKSALYYLYSNIISFCP